MGYLCLSCYEEYAREFLNLELQDGYEYFCTKATCGGSVVEIDDLLLPIIKLLNLKGYTSTYCCSGHSYEANNGGVDTYISFYRECFPDIIPEGFVAEDDEWYEKNYPKFNRKDSPDICIRKNYDEDLGEYELHQEICKTMITLLDWAKELEDMGDEY